MGIRAKVDLTAQEPAAKGSRTGVSYPWSLDLTRAFEPVAERGVEPRHVPGSADQVYNIFSRRYWLGQLDLRPLGFMRIAFGAVLFWSLIGLSPVLVDLFSDAGVARRLQLFDNMVRGAR